MSYTYSVLVIDDMKSIFNAISSILVKHDCKVDYAENGRLGLEAARKKAYDLIILDIHLPDSSGLDICSIIKNIPAYHYRPVLLLTSDNNNLEKGLMAGASDYIIKPFNTVEMLARVFTQINISKAHISTREQEQKLREDLVVERARLTEAQNDLQSYFYQTSHRLGAPLSTLKGLLNLHKIEHPEVAQNIYLKLIEDSIGKMCHINEQVARIGNLRSMSLNPRTFSLHFALENLTRRYPYGNHNIELDINEDIVLLTDLNFFLKGLEPIVKNALHYYRSGENKPGRINIHTTSEDNKTLLIIRDNGQGIPEKELSKVFDMFHISDEKSTGNGLGLFISKVALGRLDMTVSIDSKEGHYTCVTIDLTNTVILKKAANESTRIGQ
ncbi:response regulator [Fulvivirga kasyanovii]|uniref:Hybrid sensor histidine kinase/response regulator n=1 Tax=Fulvivirga kasyanovii TaxID=396812 RepID=A0ABW9RPE6_9BACT|nr:hybrid sensor histidine kinase/response regulator [Fulvivirga kasyanovii]MTI25891.1 hybrid sensor histidine kinase/response regulator [Fulvivirga kasyanovii]